jgi:hypothetical protein
MGKPPMAIVTFTNQLGYTIYLHYRVGPVNVPADNRGASNTTVPDDESIPINVEDGDVWYCYGRRQIGGEDNPPLCLADGGETVVFTESDECFVDN